MRLTRREWIGCGAASAGLMLLPGAARASVQRDCAGAGGGAGARLRGGGPGRQGLSRHADRAGGARRRFRDAGGGSIRARPGHAGRPGPAVPDRLHHQVPHRAGGVRAGRAGRIDLGAKVQDLLPDLPLPPSRSPSRTCWSTAPACPIRWPTSTSCRCREGRLWTGFAPGSQFSYCNLGYGLLGTIIARAAGTSFPAGARAAGAAADRHDAARGRRSACATGRLYAEGHVRFREDIPWMPGARLTEARWVEMENAGPGRSRPRRGTWSPICARSCSWRGRRDAAPVRGRGAALRHRHDRRRHAGRALRQRPGPHERRRASGAAAHRRHDGFSSSFTADPAAGVGAYASVNVGGAGGYRPNEMTEYAVALLRAAAQGAPLPDERQPRKPARLPEPERG
jgi:hypothetical protein